MVFIQVDEELKNACPNLKLGLLQCSVVVEPTSEALLAEIQKGIEELQANYKVENISQRSVIQASRKGYKACGKDPARYRLAAEALLRRVVQGKGLYQINNVVDALNLVSIKTGYSIGGYNADKINGKITLGIGKENEPYEGIGRGALNIANLPVLRDEAGAFGTPTSDSLRTSISDEASTFLMVFYDFDGQGALNAALDLSVELLERHAGGGDFEVTIY